MAAESADSDITEDEPDADPTIEEDLINEELRIDGICGVY